MTEIHEWVCDGCGQRFRMDSEHEQGRITLTYTDHLIIAGRQLVSKDACSWKCAGDIGRRQWEPVATEGRPA